MSGLSIKELTKDLPSGYTYVKRIANNTIECKDTNGDLVYRHFHQDIVRYTPSTYTVKIYLGQYAWSSTTRGRIRWIVNQLTQVYVGIYKSRRKTVDYEICVYSCNNSKTYKFHDGFQIRKPVNNYPEINDYEIIYRKKKLVKTKKWC